MPTQEISADPADPADSRRGDRLTAGCQRGLPDSLRQVLNPAGLREILPELLVSATRYRAVGGNYKSGYTGRARVDRKDAHKH